ncbi:hypothetical protein [Sporosarcina aquimarina]|uniref:DUF2187 domain-containing protein n=1 Tax=Sporosarcina aquimarina TaxID=114975 RepID=A0ABU4G656_9BACL|nr:hypothetical protein [Sporosarcina aquimarina]MDW0111127.1 hypothetical protein [Sporosarcina aquimarina]
MSKYSVYVEFDGGKDYQFETITNPLNVEPISINGSEMIFTEDEYGINKAQVTKIEVVEIGKGKIGEYIR